VVPSVVVMVAPGNGLVTDRFGGVVSITVIRIQIVCWLSAVSVALAAILSEPSTVNFNGSDHVDQSPGAAGLALVKSVVAVFTSTSFTLVPSSEEVPVTVVPSSVVIEAPLAGDIMEIVGAVVSEILICVVRVFMLSLSSVALTVMLSEPATVNVNGSDHVDQSPGAAGVANT